MRFPQHSGDQRQRRDLTNRINALQRELAAATEAGDALAQAVAQNNIGDTYYELRDYEPALEAYLAAGELVPAEATLDERVTPWANAAAAARKLDQWADATVYTLRIDALANQTEDAPGLDLANQLRRFVQRHWGPDWATAHETAKASLPAELAAYVRAAD